MKRKSNIRFAALLISAVVAANPAHAQANSAPENKNGEIRGTLLESISKTAIPKALIILQRNDQPALGTYTDASGNFLFHSIDPGTYLISAKHIGFVADPKHKAESITVNTGDPGEPMTLTLNRTGVVSGRVLDADGEPLAAASIQLIPVSAKKAWPGNVFFASSDDRGNYRAYSLPPGRYKVMVTYSSRT